LQLKDIDVINFNEGNSRKAIRALERRPRSSPNEYESSPYGYYIYYEASWSCIALGTK
jgi:hypothetical protein